MSFSPLLNELKKTENTPKTLVRRVHSLCGGEQVSTLLQSNYNGRKIKKLAADISEINLKISEINRKIDSVNAEIKDALASKPFEIEVLSTEENISNTSANNTPKNSDKNRSPSSLKELSSGSENEKGIYSRKMRHCGRIAALNQGPAPLLRPDSEKFFLSKDLTTLEESLSAIPLLTNEKNDPAITTTFPKPFETSSEFKGKRAETLGKSLSAFHSPANQLTKGLVASPIKPQLNNLGPAVDTPPLTPRQWLQIQEENRKVCFDAAQRIANNCENPSLYLDIILQSIHVGFFEEYSSQNILRLQAENQNNLLTSDLELHKLFQLLGPQWAPKLVSGAVKLEIESLKNMLMPMRNNTLSIKLFRQFTIYCLPGVGKSVGTLSRAFEEKLFRQCKKGAEDPGNNVVLLWEASWKSSSEQELIRNYQEKLQKIAVGTAKKIFSKIKEHFKKYTPDYYKSCCHQIVEIFKAQYLKHGYKGEALNEEQAAEKAYLLLSSVLFLRIITPNLSHLPKDTVGDLGLFFGKILTSIGNQSQRSENEFLNFIPKLCDEMRYDLLKLTEFLTAS